MTRRGLLVLLLAAGTARAQPASEPGIDDLLTQLKQAPNDPAAAALEMQIRDRWARAASPAVRLLISRGQRELSENAPDEALDSFDAALDLEPRLLEGWRGRAEARRAMGDYVGATHDVQELLRLEPRSFLAFQELSRIAESHGDWKGAFAAWQKVLELSPRTPGAQDRLADLRRRAFGEEL